jgi:hypothetical protein
MQRFNEQEILRTILIISGFIIFTFVQAIFFAKGSTFIGQYHYPLLNTTIWIFKKIHKVTKGPWQRDTQKRRLTVP